MLLLGWWQVAGDGVLSRPCDQESVLHVKKQCASVQQLSHCCIYTHVTCTICHCYEKVRRDGYVSVSEIRSTNVALL